VAGDVAPGGRPAEGRDEAFADVRLLGDDATFSAAGGLRGTTFSFANPEDQGRVWISVDETADRAIIVVGRALSSSFAQSLTDFEAMLDSVRTEQS
jgi:hypothetical protein